MKKYDPRDASPVVTAEDIRRRYNLESLNEPRALSVASSGSIRYENGSLEVITVDKAIWGDKRPISSGGVYTITGNIEKALENI